ncbi:hypothetical protein AQ490_01425 [Wenjunlia vitaminophila]|uniref:Uncharacterized protein n=1 Tax=Wenjunlia vitaminophila TaxID=76728 RepID=A0A0T6LZB8_WENVI|nr:hypothetical protein [Wenjunlia vitaminophila]KRV51444.1 hypothetical protein AQ490_01425 [Wenjunlia vitaminophila]
MPAPATETVPSEARSFLPFPGGTWLLRYEWHRLTGVRSTWLTLAVALCAGLLVTLLLGRGTYAASRHEDLQRLLTSWLPGLPLPPAALGAGLLGALSFGQEFRYPALAPAQVSVERRLRLLLAKLVATAVCALLLAAATLSVNALGVRYTVDPEGGAVPRPVLPLLTWWAVLVVGSAWVGLLAAALFRSSVVGALWVLAVPVLVEPMVGWLADQPLLGPTLGLFRQAVGALATGGGGPLVGAGEAARVLAAGPAACTYGLTLLVLLLIHIALTVRRRTGWRFPG